MVYRIPPPPRPKPPKPDNEYYKELDTWSIIYKGLLVGAILLAVMYLMVIVYFETTGWCG